MRLRRVLYCIMALLSSFRPSPVLPFEHSIGIWVAFWLRIPASALDGIDAYRNGEEHCTNKTYISITTYPAFGVIKPRALHFPSSTAVLPPSFPLLSLKHPRRIIHHPYILNDILQARHKREVRRVFLEVIPPILLVLEMRYESVRESSLYRTIH